MNNTLYVGNLAESVTERGLQELFAQHGVVEKTNLILDHATGRPRGFAFVTMATPEAAQAAMQKVNGQNYEGRNLTVNEARAREERSSRPSGGGGRGGQRPHGNR